MRRVLLVFGFVLSCGTQPASVPCLEGANCPSGQFCARTTDRCTCQPLSLGSFPACPPVRPIIGAGGGASGGGEAFAGGGEAFAGGEPFAGGDAGGSATGGGNTAGGATAGGRAGGAAGGAVEPWSQEARLQTAGIGVLNGIELATSVDLAADGEMALLGAPKAASGAFRSAFDMSAPGAGGFLAYSFASTFWTDPWFLNEATQTAGAELGTTVALNRDGGFLAIAASPFLQVGGVANVGSVVTYVFSSGSWNRVNSVASPAVELDTRFGHALALTSSGDRLVVGVWRDDVGATGASPRRQDGGVVANVGGAYVFVRTGNTFVLEASLKPATAAPGQLFGRAVSINARGDFVAIGAPGAQQVSFFSRASTTWTPDMTLTEPTVAAGSEFGASVSLSGNGNVLVVGAPAEGRAGLGVDPTSTASRPGSGAAFVYARQPVTFVRKAYLKATWGSARFGASVRVGDDGTSAVVGAPLDSTNGVGVNPGPTTGVLGTSGAAFVYRDSGPRWVVDASLKASLPTAGAEFGRSVAISSSGDRVLVGSPFMTRSAPNSGMGYVFRRR